MFHKEIDSMENEIEREFVVFNNLEMIVIEQEDHKKLLKEQKTINDLSNSAFRNLIKAMKAIEDGRHDQGARILKESYEKFQSLLEAAPKINHNLEAFLQTK